MKKIFAIGFGALMVAIGLLMLFVMFKSDSAGADRGQAIIAPLGLIGAGALAISSSRKPPKKW